MPVAVKRQRRCVMPGTSPFPRGFYSEQVPPSPSAPEGAQVVILSDDDLGHTIDPDSGAAHYETGDGGVVIDLAPQTLRRDIKDISFGANLAEVLGDDVLDQIGSELLQAIESDDESRREWLETRSRGIDMLGFKVEGDRSSNATGSPVDGMSTVRHPLLAEAVVRFQANASAELLPSDGPVRVRNDTPPAPPNAAAFDNSPPAVPGINSADLAEALEKDLNHYLTQTDKGYRPDCVRMLFWVGFGGCGFRKVYQDPVLRRPVSRSVDAQDLIVNNNCNDLADAGRVTHRIKMRRSTMVRMRLAGAYRKVDHLATPVEDPDPVQIKVSEVQGFRSTPTRPEDHEYTVYECYCELDIPGFEHEDEDGNVSGLQLPYKVSIEKDSRQVLEIRRNWRQDDETFAARKRFVKFAFIPAMGFYDIGLLQLVGNTARALTGAQRLMLDAGMFSNFPGFLYANTAGRQKTNEFRVPPGGGVEIQTGGLPIGQVVMPLPYKDVSTGLMALAKEIEDSGQRLAGTAELQVAESRQDAPVGTTLAMIEQATKIMSAVHITLHAAQAEEFQLLKEAFEEDPQAFWRGNRKPARKWEEAEFLAALDEADLVPAADPNTSSHMHRIMKAVAIKQLQAANPQLYDAKEVDQRILRMIGVTDTDSLFLPPQPAAAAPPDPKLLALQLKAQTQQQQMALKAEDAKQDAVDSAQANQQHQQDVMTESADRAADRSSRERVAQTREDTERLKLASQAVHQQQAGLAQPPPASAPGGQAVDEMNRMRNAAREHQFAPFANTKAYGLASGGAVRPPRDPPDMSDSYNTPLPPHEEAQFQAWASKNPRLGGTYDYDARGFWRDGAGPSDNGHGSDTWKKPNHPTFSDESKYHGADGYQGGQWLKDDGGEYAGFAPSQTNLDMHGAQGLRSYFDHAEPAMTLALPDQSRADGGSVLPPAPPVPGDHLA